MLKTNGRFLNDSDGSSGENIILRGVNLPLLDDWDFPQMSNSSKLEELVQTGANAIRIEWYYDYKTHVNSKRPPYSIQDLDLFLDKCKEHKIIPILGLWDFTCNPDVTLLNTLLMNEFWTVEATLTVLKKHQQYLIINLANELGNYRWIEEERRPDALEAYKTEYKTAITSIREHLQLPIIIDAPDGGTSIEVFEQIGQELIDHDPEHNLLLSGHAYWSDYDGLPHLEKLIQANLPIVFCEIANKQTKDLGDGREPAYCFYALDGTGQENPPQQGNFTYQAFLQTLTEKEVGWLAWAWWKDGCPDRQMAVTREIDHVDIGGNFSELTPYGDTIVNNPIFGLKATAQRANIFD
jgi:mannan endo-1,4-beta-mannosidase